MEENKLWKVMNGRRRGKAEGSKSEVEGKERRVYLRRGEKGLKVKVEKKEEKCRLRGKRRKGKERRVRRGKRKN